VTITGYNFTSYVNDKLKVYLNETEITGTSVFVSSTGGFAVTVQVPGYTPAGVASISIRNRDGVNLAEGVFTVYGPELRLDKLGGKVGTTVNAVCRGFFPGKPVTILYSFDSTEATLGNAIAGETGECSVEFNIPASPQGRHLVVARNDEGHFASVPFETIPSFTVEPRTAATGDKVTILGTGFPPDTEISVGLSLYEQKVAYAKSQERGSFTAQFIVPVLKAGTYLVTIEEFSGEVMWGEIAIVTRLTVNKTAGEVGARIKITGTGFEVRSTVFIRYDAVDATFVNTDDNGAFSIEFTIPQSISGPHIITATDGANIKQFIYTVEAEPPASPEPMSPKGRAEVSPPVTFDWESVYDLSEPITYSIEIARSRDFQRPILQKTGLKASQYTVSAKESLLPNRKGTYYYWRVSATDGASNVGGWSEPVVFRVKPVDILPTWAKHMLIGAALAIALLYLIQLRRGLRALKATG